MANAVSPWYQKYLLYQGLSVQYAPYAMAMQIGLPLMLVMMLIGHLMLHK